MLAPEGRGVKRGARGYCAVVLDAASLIIAFLGFAWIKLKRLIYVSLEATIDRVSVDGLIVVTEKDIPRKQQDLEEELARLENTELKSTTQLLLNSGEDSLKRYLRQHRSLGKARLQAAGHLLEEQSTETAKIVEHARAAHSEFVRMLRVAEEALSTGVGAERTVKLLAKDAREGMAVSETAMGMANVFADLTGLGLRGTPGKISHLQESMGALTSSPGGEVIAPFAKMLGILGKVTEAGNKAQSGNYALGISILEEGKAALDELLSESGDDADFRNILSALEITVDLMTHNLLAVESYRRREFVKASLEWDQASQMGEQLAGVVERDPRREEEAEYHRRYSLSLKARAEMTRAELHIDGEGFDEAIGCYDSAQAFLSDCSQGLIALSFPAADPLREIVNVLGLQVIPIQIGHARQAMALKKQRDELREEALETAALIKGGTTTVVSPVISTKISSTMSQVQIQEIEGSAKEQLRLLVQLLRESALQNSLPSGLSEEAEEVLSDSGPSFFQKLGTLAARVKTAVGDTGELAQKTLPIVNLLTILSNAAGA